MRIIYMYHHDDPEHGSVVPGSLPNPQLAFQGYVPLTLTQRPHDEQRNQDPSRYVQTLEIRNQDVKLPQDDDTLYWCNVFEMQQFRQKQHLIKVGYQQSTHSALY